VVRGRRSASGVVGAGPSPTGTRFVAPVVERAAESLSTSIFVQGTGEETTMRLTLSDAEGNPVGGEASLTVPARGTVTATLSELFPSLDSGDFLGAVTGSSAAPVAMSVVLAGHGRESGLSMPVDASGGGPGSE